MNSDFCELHKIILIESRKIVSDVIKSKAELYRIFYTNDSDLDKLRCNVRVPQKYIMKFKPEQMKILTGHFSPPSIVGIFKRPTFKNIFNLRLAENLIDLNIQNNIMTVPYSDVNWSLPNNVIIVPDQSMPTSKWIKTIMETYDVKYLSVPQFRGLNILGISSTIAVIQFEAQ
ncbi:hypothetical protein MXB_820, partial [Myxobolus squamalis]